MAKDVKLLLTDNVDNLGIVGDVVSVRPGYARNFLMPRGLATKPTEGNIKRLAARRAQVEAEMKARREQLEAMFEKIKGHEITMQRSHNEQGILFGGIAQHEIAEVLRSEGFHVEDRMIRIGVTIKRLDSYMIPLVLAADLKTEVKLWVVSDKPAEELKTEAEPAARDAADKSASPEDQAPAAKKEKKPRKAKAAAAEDAPAQAE